MDYNSKDRNSDLDKVSQSENSQYQPNSKVLSAVSQSRKQTIKDQEPKIKNGITTVSFQLNRIDYSSWFVGRCMNEESSQARLILSREMESRSKFKSWSWIQEETENRSWTTRALFWILVRTPRSNLEVFIQIASWDLGQTQTTKSNQRTDSQHPKSLPGFWISSTETANLEQENRTKNRSRSTQVTPGLRIKPKLQPCRSELQAEIRTLRFEPEKFKEPSSDLDILTWNRHSSNTELRNREEKRSQLAIVSGYHTIELEF